MIAAGRKSKISLDRVRDLLFGNLRRAERFDEHAHRMRDADRIGDLHSQRSASPAATTFLATQRAAYAAERSTLVGSLPENAPPPWRAIPPYVSAMILRPVSPASPFGPPMTKRPVGLTKTRVFRSYIARRNHVVDHSLGDLAANHFQRNRPVRAASRARLRRRAPGGRRRTPP